MRLDEPRVAPLEADAWDEKAKEVMARFDGPGEVLNIFKTLVNHPDLMRRWIVFGNHVLGKSTLDVRERELVILRIGYLCQSAYEWGQHVLISREAGMTEEEIRSCKTDSRAPGLSELDRLLFKATEELHEDAFIADETWSGLQEYLSTQQLMDLVFTVGQYNLVSMALNTFGVQADKGLPGWDV
ncbi:MAG: carboxymuconolactone decarboxylase family protein [Pseudomonadales bacterium]|jgi:alkylhydroperoxidase family enzyme|nr:carboxymuconolactone decarboxylase family protein [Pseudomonadales bacterium]MDP6470458.1 carboxymuconolactone decarboxylase family protein [Pseudomonadales bacterium]MDP6827760.1 carboxymuconolactone decarboxylase family protein [Pseudomonadales bacterium]MDP6973402.1 carboxymuconolactone decarboxylase family protein [Pseudomonadales bacterium]|tara:strand:- start:2407 stop:2961 length:555 start_codon:yes stop_codon:yes gene_type:complete